MTADMLLEINPIRIAAAGMNRSVVIGWCALGALLALILLLHRKIARYQGAPKGVEGLVEAAVLAVSHIRNRDLKRVVSAIYKKPLGKPLAAAFAVYAVFAVLILFFGKPTGEEQLHVSLIPEPFYLRQINMDLSVVASFAVMGVLVFMLAVLQRKIENFSDKPGRLQSFLEAVVEMANGFTKRRFGHLIGLMACLVLSLVLYLLIDVSIEALGLLSLGGVNVGLSVVTGWCALGVLLILLVIARFKIGKFTEVPSSGFQRFIEAALDGAHSFAESKVGHAADFSTPVTLTFVLYLLSVTLVELFGLPPATEDINCTLGLGISAFISVNAAGILYKGVGGRFRVLVKPTPMVAPIKVLTDLIAPISMSIRLFANVMVGGVIMTLIYEVAPIILPAALSSYFSLGHVLLQAFVFGLLTLIYTGEVVEE